VPGGVQAFQLINNGTKAIWLGVNSGAQPAPASANFCGTVMPGQACSVPGTECSPLAKPPQCFYVGTNIGETQACSSTNPTCPAGQSCNTSMGLCQWNLDYDYASTCSATNLNCPSGETCDLGLGVCLKNLQNVPGQPLQTIPAADLVLTSKETTVLCVPSEPTAPGSAPGQSCTQNSDCASAQCNFYPPSAPVQQCTNGMGCVCGPINPFSGGIYARTDCQTDGTNCQGGDCLNAPYQPCPLGKGAGNPSTQAEFTLSEFSQDFYDVTVINGANAQIAMAPTGVPTSAPPTSETPEQVDYWCKTPGGTAAQGLLPGCSWAFDTTNVNSGNQTNLLTQVSLPDCSQPIATATATPAASVPTPAQIGCPMGSTCSANGASSYYCKPTLPTCTSSSQCPGMMPCVNGFCSPDLQCTAATDCQAGQACVNGLCQGVGCSTDTDCSGKGLESATCLNETVNPGTGTTTMAKVCVPLTCDTSVSCPTGFSCTNNVCQPSQTSCTLTSPCPSVRQSCVITPGGMTGTCVTQPTCNIDGSCPVSPNPSVCSSGQCVPGGVTCTYSATNDEVCPNGTACPMSGQCPGYCTSDSDCADVAGTCVAGACQPLTADTTTNWPNGYTELSDKTCALSCTGASSCTSSIFGSFCGTGEFNANVLQTCGVPTGSIWSMDDFCGISGMGTYGGVNCGAMAQAGDSFANMFGCNGSGMGSAVSCYNNPNDYDTCCGCPTNSGSLLSPWNTTIAALTCSQTNQSVWVNQVAPWLQYLKAACPTAYSFPFDDATSTFQCQSLGTNPPVTPAPSVTPTAGVVNTMNYALTFDVLATPTATSTP
jgi:hypothetical protein